MITASHPNTLEHRGLKPIAVLAADRPHGDRLRYVAGCRCDLCRASNAAYERGRIRERQSGNWNGMVPADRARNYMKHLSAQGVGRRAIAEASDISHSVINEIRAGRKTQIRALTERKILAVTVDMALDRAYIPAGPTWKLIDALLAAGFTKKDLAQRLGYRSSLQISRKAVTVKNAARVRKLHAALIDSDEALTDSKRARHWLHALRDEGYTEKQLERHLDLPGGLATLHKPRITRAIEKQVKAAFERLTA